MGDGGRVWSTGDDFHTPWHSRDRRPGSPQSTSILHTLSTLHAEASVEISPLILSAMSLSFVINSATFSQA